MSEIDRRTTINLAGVGTLTAGSGSQGDQPVADEGPNGNLQDPPVTTTDGLGNLYGQSVLDTWPKDDRGAQVGSVRTFDPDRICIVLCRFEAGGQLTARRTYIPMPSPADLNATVWDAISRLSAGQTVDANYDKDHIDPISLRGQRLLVVYLDNDPGIIRFKYNRDSTDAMQVKQSYGYTLRFAPYRGSDPGDQKPKENHAFFAADRMIFANIQPPRSDTAFTLQYWDTDYRGEPVGNVQIDDPDTHFMYSLNVLLEARAPSGSGYKWVPLIVDPDTGNMGAEP